MITRRTSVLSLVTVLLAMLLGMANPVFASPPGATPVDPPTEAADSGQKDGVSNLAADQQPRMLKDGSRPMSEDEIRAEDAMWEELRPWLDTFDDELADRACMPGRAQALVDELLTSETPTREEILAAWEEVHAQWLIPTWKSWMNHAGPVYIQIDEQTIGDPPSWVPYRLMMGNYMLVRLDPKYPGCSTGTYSPDL